MSLQDRVGRARQRIILPSINHNHFLKVEMPCRHNQPWNSLRVSTFAPFKHSVIFQNQRQISVSSLTPTWGPSTDQSHFWNDIKRSWKNIVFLIVSSSACIHPLSELTVALSPPLQNKSPTQLWLVSSNMPEKAATTSCISSAWHHNCTKVMPPRSRANFLNTGYVHFFFWCSWTCFIIINI